MLNIKRNIVSGSARHVFSKPSTMQYIVIHETDNTGRSANAKNHAILQVRGNDRRASWTSTVDDKEVWESYELSDAVQSAGSSYIGRNHIAIEICVNLGSDYLKSVDNAARLTALYMRKIVSMGYAKPKLLMHKDVTGKNCPRKLLAGKSGITLTQFRANVDAYYFDGGTTPTYTKLIIDGIRGPITNKEWQYFLNKIGYYTGYIDGVFGTLTIKSLQRWLISHHGEILLVDGITKARTFMALQRMLRKQGLYRGLIDGVEGVLTIKAEQTYLNNQRGAV